MHSRQPSHVPVQFIDANTGSLLLEEILEAGPHPGSRQDLAGSPYLVLEKRHTYHLRDGRYRLHRVRAYVRALDLGDVRDPSDQVIGDPTCGFNAHSPLLRCAVHPSGPCKGCKDYLVF